MKCLICGTGTEYFFSKAYTEKPFNELMKDIGEVQYYKCPNCGFTLSKTHAEMDAPTWEHLNYEFHHYLENRSDNEAAINQPPYLQQALMLKVLAENGIINFKNNLDYAGGYGTLSNILAKYFGIPLSIYDPYVQSESQHNYVAKEDLKTYDAVFNSALFEHLTTREAFDEINKCVAPEGCMIIHTRICGYIPNDPDWFYLNAPVHCAFHTNESMRLLMEQWGYVSSIYCVAARCWVLLKKELTDVNTAVEAINKELQTAYLTYKTGFVDYWPHP